MGPALERAVDAAYRVFPRYDLGGGIEVCHCPVCVAPEFERALSATPLREISRELMSEYTGSAHGWGTDKIANDMRYLLPRYFDLIAQRQYPSSLDAEYSLSRLHLDHYRAAWPADEAATIDAFFLALFRETLLAPIDIDARNGQPVARGADLCEVLLLISRAGGDFAPLLDAWEGARCRAADLRLAVLVAGLAPADMDRWWAATRSFDAGGAARSIAERHALDDGRLGIDREMQRTIRWLARPEIRARLEEAFLAEQEPPAAAMLSHAEQIVAALIVR